MKTPRFSDTPRFSVMLALLAACFAGLFVWVINAGLADGTTIGLAIVLILVALSLLFSAGVCHSKQQAK